MKHLLKLLQFWKFFSLASSDSNLNFSVKLQTLILYWVEGCVTAMNSQCALTKKFNIQLVPTKQVIQSYNKIFVSLLCWRALEDVNQRTTFAAFYDLLNMTHKTKHPFPPISCLSHVFYRIRSFVMPSNLFWCLEIPEWKWDTVETFRIQLPKWLRSSLLETLFILMTTNSLDGVAKQSRRIPESPEEKFSLTSRISDFGYSIKLSAKICANYRRNFRPSTSANILVVCPTFFFPYSFLPDL